MLIVRELEPEREPEEREERERVRETAFLGPALRGERQCLVFVSRTLPGLQGVLGSMPVWYFSRHRPVEASRVLPGGHGDFALFKRSRQCFVFGSRTLPGLHGVLGRMPVWYFSRQRPVEASRVLPEGHGDFALFRRSRQRLVSESRTLPGLHGVLGRMPVWYFARQRLVARSRVLPSGHLLYLLWLDIDIDFDFEPDLEPKNKCGIFLRKGKIILFLFILNVHFTRYFFFK